MKTIRRSKGVSLFLMYTTPISASVCIKRHTLGVPETKKAQIRRNCRLNLALAHGMSPRIHLMYGRPQRLLQQYIRSNNKHAITLLLGYGLVPDSVDDFVRAARRGREEVLLEIMSARGDSVDLEPALRMAAAYGSPGSVSILLKTGVRVSKRVLDYVRWDSDGEQRYYLLRAAVNKQNKE